MKHQREKLNNIVAVRFSDEEIKKIESDCDALGITRSDLIRASTLGKRIQVRKIALVDATAISELSRFGGLLKKLYNDSNGIHADETGEILLEVKALIRSMQKGLER